MTRTTRAMRRNWIGLAIAALLFAQAAPVAAEPAELGWADAPAVAFDVALVRPLSAVAMVAGIPFYLVTAPFAAMAGDATGGWQVFVKAPADYAFRRELARF